MFSKELIRVWVTLRLTVSQSLVSSPFCRRLTRYCFLFKSLGLEFVVLSLWGALSDERPGLSFESHSLVIIYICIYKNVYIYIYIYGKCVKDKWLDCDFQRIYMQYTYTIQYMQGLFQSRFGTADYALLLTSSSRHSLRHLNGRKHDRRQV
jgi:hypothetical protein